MTRDLTLPADERPARPLWRNGNFQLLWISVAASGFADRMTQLGAWSMLGFHLKGAQTASISAGVSFFFFLPYVVLGLPAGWVADTLPRKWVMMGCDLGRAAIMLLAVLMVPAGAAVAAKHYFWEVYAIMAAVGTLAALFNPAKNATVPVVVPVSQLQPGNAIVLGIAVIASLIGFVVGGPIVEHHSVRGALLLGVCTYCVSGSLFSLMRLRQHARMAVGPRPSELRRMWDAISYTLRHRPLMELLGLSVLFWGASYVLLAAIAAMCKDRYGISPADELSATTTMMAVLGAGMLASSLGVAWMNTRRESAWFTMVALMLAGLLIVGMAVSRSYALSVALAASVGFFGNTAMICVATLTQSLAPDYIRGRVFAVRDLASMTSAVVVNLVIWLMPHADAAMIPALWCVAALLGLVGAWGLWREITRGPLATRGVNVFWRIDRAVVLVWHRLRWVGRERVPGRGPVILVSNHTAGVDPFLIQAAMNRCVRWVMLTEFRFALLAPLWHEIHPIVLDGPGGKLGGIRAILAALKAGEPVGFFPEGGLQRDKRQLQPFHPGIAMVARRSGAPLLPIWIAGTPATRNMVWHFLRPSRSTVTFGKPYRPDPAWTDAEIVEDLRARIVALSGQVEQAVQASRVGEYPNPAGIEDPGR